MNGAASSYRESEDRRRQDFIHAWLHLTRRAHAQYPPSAARRETLSSHGNERGRGGGEAD